MNTSTLSHMEAASPLMRAKVFRRNAYGNTYIDPANDVARRLCELVGRKTLTVHDTTQAKRMGFSFEVMTGPNVSGEYL